MSDYLTDEEQVERLKRLWKEWGLVAVSALVLGVGLTVGKDFYESYQDGEAQAAANLYADYLEAKALGEPASLFISELASDHDDSAYYAFALLHQAKDQVEAGTYESALESLSRAVEAGEGSPIIDLIRIRKAKVEFELEDFDAVLTTVVEIESDGFRWQALMLKGDVHMQRDELELASEAYVAAKESLPLGIATDEVNVRVASVPSQS